MIDNKATPHNILLAGKRVLISGGTTGIGRATAMLLAAHGAKILIFGRHEQYLNDAINDLKTTGGDVIGMTADKSTKEGLETVFKTVDKKMGGLDIYINNAAIGGGNLFDENYRSWKYLIETNLLGYLSFAKYAADRMEKQDEGHIINIGSLSADEREPGSEVYVATKAAIQAFSESFRKTVNPKGIKVTLIEPGIVGTDMQPESPPKQRRLEKEKKMLMAEDIAQVVFFCLTQPKRSDVIVVKVRPHLQII